MNAQDLRNSILQLAIQGKLVEQREEEGTGIELLEQIKTEKELLIKEKKINKEKPIPEITANEIPFDIPNSWEWVRLKTIVYNRGQVRPSDKFSYIDIGSINNIEQKLNSDPNIIEPSKAPSRARKLVDYGDILYSTVRPYLHNMCIIDRAFTYQPIASTGFAVMTCCGGVYNKYLFNYLQSPSFDSYANSNENSKGVAYPAINDERLYRAIVPIPPLEEQKRIVAKIEELIPHIEKYGDFHSKVVELNKKFPEDMQKSILQYAIKGKLVEQREEEGTAEELYQQIQEEKAKLIKEGKIKKEKPLAEMTEDEVPYEIPLSWKWVRLNEISLKIADIDHKMPPTVEKGYPYVSPLNFTTDSIDYDSAKKIGRKDFEHLSRKIKPERNDIIFPRYGTIGVVRLVDTDKEFLVSYSCCTIKTMKKYVLPLFVFYTLKSGMIKGEISRYINKTTQPNVGLESIKKFVFPLPPLQEQKRIVAKIEKLMPHCQQLVE